MELKLARLISGELVVGEYAGDPMKENLGGIHKALSIKVRYDSTGQLNGVAIFPPFDPFDKNPVDINANKIMYFGTPDTQLVSAYLKSVSDIVQLSGNQLIKSATKFP